MKRYYIEEDDKGKEIKRKLTTFDSDDFTQLSDDELLNAYYQATAEFYSKARHVKKIEKDLIDREIDLRGKLDMVIEAGNNIIEAIEEVNN